MVSSFTFSHVPEIHFGIGKLNILPSKIKHFGNFALLVIGKASLQKSEPFHQLLASLESVNINYEIANIDQEPTIELIDSITELYRSMRPAVVVAIGGGSVIDAGKAISAMLRLNGSVAPYLEGNKEALTHNGIKIPFIAIPTTAGTGSETTKNAVLSHVGPNGYKRSLRHNNFIPNIAIIDPSLALHCPPEVTAASGLDTFTQLFESYISTTATPITDLLAMEGMTKVVNNLSKAYKNGNDIEARSAMGYASMLSGITLANVGLGVVHGYASSVGGFFNIPHGVICGTLLGSATVLNINKLIECSSNHIVLMKLANVGRLFCKEQDKSDYYYILALTDAIETWIDEMNIPKLGTFGVEINDVERIIEATGLKNNPVFLTKDELAQILIARI